MGIRLTPYLFTAISIRQWNNDQDLLREREYDFNILTHSNFLLRFRQLTLLSTQNHKKYNFYNTFMKTEVLPEIRDSEMEKHKIK